MSSFIVLKGFIQYVDCNLADENVECKPVLITYYDTHFERTHGKGIIQMHLDEHDLSKRYPFELSAQNKFALGDTIPETACIGFASGAERRNEFGAACYTNAGTAAVQIGDILRDVKHKGKFERRLPLLMETTRLMGDPVRKGDIVMCVEEDSIGTKIRFLPADQCLLGASDARDKQGVEAVTELLNRRVAAERAMKDTWPNTSGMRAPMCISSAGIQRLKVAFVPVEGFAISEPMVVNEGYFVNAFERSMIRKGFASPYHDFHDLDLAHQCEVMAELFSYAPQAFDYVSDTVDRSSRKQGPYRRNLKTPMEDFSHMGVWLSGDCEDGCKLCQSLRESFQSLSSLLRPQLASHKFQFTNSLMQPAKDSHEVMRRLHFLSSQYVCFMTLATVHGAKAEDNTEHLGAHMYGLLLPQSQVKDALMHTEDGRLQAKVLPLKSDKVEGKLPTLFLEGTGRIRPLGTGPVPTDHPVLGRPAFGVVESHARQAIAANLIGESSNHPLCYDPLFEERRYIAMNMPSKGGLKTELPHDVGAPSGFYLGNLLLVTSDFINQGHNVGAFICGTIQEDGEITRGTLFTDIINQRDNFALIPCEPMSKEVMAITQEAVALSVPPRPFLFDPAKVNPKDNKHPLLERMKTEVAAMDRSGHAPYGSVDLFIRPHQMSDETIDLMIRDIHSMDRLFKMDYEKEYITNEVCTYRVMLFVNKE
jgi:hypothetical protein